MKASKPVIDRLEKNEVFVFGSNREGRHGKGAAYLARERFGAAYGIGKGIVGQTYAIPTRKNVKDNGGWNIVTLPLEEIRPHVNDFINFTMVHKELDFLVTEVGCGNAGYKPEEMAPLFLKAIDCENIFLPQSFINVLSKFEEKKK